MPKRNFFARLARFKSFLTGAMKRRLIIYTLLFTFLLAGTFTGTIMLFGRFAQVDRQLARTLNLQLAVFEQDISDYFDNLAARGIVFSRQLSSHLESWLADSQFTFRALNGDPAAIAALQADLYTTLQDALAITDCSGAYYLLDLTANPDLPKATSSRSGMYIKLANINVTRPVNPKLLLFRGYTSSYSSHRGELHNMWQLEFNTDDFPAWPLGQTMPDTDLNSSFCFSDVLTLPGTWEDVLFLCVPLLASDGSVYGVCGFEISQLYFKLHHSQSGAIPNVTSLLARRNEAGLDSDNGLKCGDKTGFFLELTGTLHCQQLPFFNIYKTANAAFIGKEKTVRLSNREEERIAAVLLPKSDYDKQRQEHIRENIIIALLLFLAAAFGSIFMSRVYVEPIIRGLSQAKNSDADPALVNILEIDDLLEFLARQDKVYEAERLELTRQIAVLDKVKEPASDRLPSQPDFALFLENLATLTKTERELFDLYMQGYRAKHMPALLSRSMNTIKTHNKRIYDKLGVSSRQELMAYMKMMQKQAETEPSRN